MEWTLRNLIHSWRESWHAEDRQRMRVKAFYAHQRRVWDGEVIRKTGEIVPRESA